MISSKVLRLVQTNIKKEAEEEEREEGGGKKIKEKKIRRGKVIDCLTFGCL